MAKDCDQFVLTNSEEDRSYLALMKHEYVGKIAKANIIQKDNINALNKDKSYKGKHQFQWINQLRTKSQRARSRITSDFLIKINPLRAKKSMSTAESARRTRAQNDQLVINNLKKQFMQDNQSSLKVFIEGSLNPRDSGRTSELGKGRERRPSTASETSLSSL